MKPISLSEIAETQGHSQGLSKGTVLRSDEFNAVQVILDPGKEISPHPEDYAVLFVVIEGQGRITTGDGVWKVRPGDVVHLDRGETRGIAADTWIRLLGIQERRNSE
ncbi:MAG: cupin domain-containing protein [Candidatus Thermoplasmatota archaeon]|nr:cupin domain-containing protein [Candidatus Thermoplasmatota archaeon]